MAKLFVSGYDQGVRKDVDSFLLPENAFSKLEDAYIWRGKVRKRRGFFNNGRLRRVIGATVLVQTTGAGVVTDTIVDLLNDGSIALRATEANAEIQPGSVTIATGAPDAGTWQDNVTNGVMTATGGIAVDGTINYATGEIVLNYTGATVGGGAITATFNYYPSFPVMGLRTREVPAINAENTVAFDTKYAYTFTAPAGWAETPSTLAMTWNGSNSQFFYTTNYYRDAAANKIFWATNNNHGLHGFAVTAFGGGVGTTTVTAAGNTFQAGDVVYFLNLAGAAAGNNLFYGTVTVPGNPFTITQAGLTYIAGVCTGLVLSGYRNTNGDGIKYYNGTRWFNFNPPINNTTALMGCKILIPFKNRLIAFNTFEGNNLGPASTNFPNRARYSQNGTPLIVSDATVTYVNNPYNSWLDNVVGRGGYIDAPTSEHIVSAEIIKDKLIVFFERSTWEFVYTGNHLLPFVWKNINTELGSESTFSTVIFDDGILGIGNVGIHSANINGVQKINLQIPDFSQEINNSNSGYDRVYGIRDFNNEMVYWTYTSFVGNPIFPNRVLSYNYRNNTYSYYRDRFTCFGYFQKTTSYTWASLPYKTWASWTVPWNAGIGQSYYYQIIAGNQQGFTHLFNESCDNDISLSVTAIAGTTITCPNHGLEVGQYIRFDSLTGGTITPIDHSTDTYKVMSITNVNQFVIDGTAAGTYPGGGFIEVINHIDIRTKDFAPFLSEDYNMRYKLINFLFTKTEDGEVDVNFYINENSSEAIVPLVGTTAVRTRPETNDTFAEDQEKIWHGIYPNYSTDFVTIRISLSDSQIRDEAIEGSEFEMHAMRITADPGDKLR